LLSGSANYFSEIKSIAKFVSIIKVVKGLPGYSIDPFSLKKSKRHTGLLRKPPLPDFLLKRVVGKD
jgi:hypothetical protein